MAWLELTLHVKKEQVMRCSQALEALGALAVSYYDAQHTPILEPLPGDTPLWETVKIVGLFEPDKDLLHLDAQLKKEALPLDYTLSRLEEQEWTRAWLTHFHPMSFGKHLWVIPETHTWRPTDQNAVILTLDPGLAFGTGTHPTTALCLRWLEQNRAQNQNATVIDYGCGSGILSIAALLLGAKQVWAIDHDPQALTSTKANLQKNHIHKTQCIVQFPHDPLPSPPFADLIIANILVEPLIALAPTFCTLSQKKGKIVLSGLLASQIEQVKAAYTYCHFETPLIQEEWALLIGTPS